MSDRLRRLFAFPDPVNETSARLVAAGVVVQGALFLVVQQWWVLVPLTYGFVARVAAGPRFSPLGRLATQVSTPRWHRRHRFVPGPPKRFAQAMGLTFSGAALVAQLAGAGTASVVLIAALMVAASLEAFAGVCLGCMVFQRLMRWGIIPESVCEACNDIGRRVSVGG